MKILLVSDYSVPRGGNEVVTLSLRDGLRARGHDVRLFASRAYADAGAEPAEYGCFGTATPLRAAFWTSPARSSPAYPTRIAYGSTRIPRATS